MSQQPHLTKAWRKSVQEMASFDQDKEKVETQIGDWTAIPVVVVNNTCMYIDELSSEINIFSSSVPVYCTCTRDLECFDQTSVSLIKEIFEIQLCNVQLCNVSQFVGP